MIEGYDPELVGDRRVTPFTARLPDGTRDNNIAGQPFSMTVRAARSPSRQAPPTVEA